MIASIVAVSSRFIECLNTFALNLNVILQSIKSIKGLWSYKLMCFNITDSSKGQVLKDIRS